MKLAVVVLEKCGHRLQKSKANKRLYIPKSRLNVGNIFILINTAQFRLNPIIVEKSNY